MREELKKQAEAFNFTLDETTLDRFEQYGYFLLQTNEKMNLTAIKDPKEVAIKHFLDSFLPLHFYSIPQNASFIDVGSGAGFPGIPLMILRPDLKGTLMDATGKRVRFLEEACRLLGLSANCVHARAEELGHNPAYRERFDLVTARAVAHLRELSEYCLPFLKVGGMFLALKGPQMETECREAQKAIFLLGGSAPHLQEYTLDQMGRTLVQIQKKSQTPTNYPRPAAKIAKKPLE